MATSAMATFKAPAKVQSLAQQVQKPLQEDTVPSKPRARQPHFIYIQEGGACMELKMEHGTAVLNQSEPRGAPLL